MARRLLRGKKLMIIQSPQVDSVQLLANATGIQKVGIFEQIPLPACIVNLNNQQILRTNHAFSNFLEVYSLDINEITFPYARLANSRPLLNEEFTLISKKKRQITFLLTSGDAFAGADGDLNHIIYLNDITYTKKIEELKKTINQLKQAQALAEHANKNKTVFLANVSHEIRTPLTAILGFADLLKDGAISDIEKIQFAETINRNGNALIKIIDDVLDLSKVEVNCLELEKIELSPQQLLHDVVHQFKAKAHTKNIYLLLDIQNDLPQTILSDSVRIQQVLSNLLSNAIKFTDQGGVIVQVKSCIKKQSKAEILIRVIDTGIGLTEDQKERLFQPFSQAELSTTRKFGGNGLGLALSKHLAEALGGQLVIEQGEKDMGCTFAFTLTADIPAVSSNKTENKKMSQQMDFVPLSGFNILLAEDSIDNQYFVEKFLAKHGATVAVAGNGHEVIQLSEKQNFDIILMDIEMPEMDGYAATRILRQRGFKKPILALTAHAMAEERSKTREAGCDGHLTKPIDTAQLLAALEKHLKKSEKRNVKNII